MWPEAATVPCTSQLEFLQWHLGFFPRSQSFEKVMLNATSRKTAPDCAADFLPDTLANVDTIPQGGLRSRSTRRFRVRDGDWEVQSRYIEDRRTRPQSTDVRVESFRTGAPTLSECPHVRRVYRC